MKFIFSWEKGFHSFAALTCGIFFPLEDKLHMFAPPCNILYLLNWLNPDKEKELESHITFWPCKVAVSVSQSCHKQLIFIFFGNKEIFFLSNREFSRTMAQIQGLSRAWKFLSLIPGLSRIYMVRGIHAIPTTYQSCIIRLKGVYFSKKNIKWFP